MSNDPVGRGFEKAGEITGNVISQGIGAALGMGAKITATKPVDVAKQLIETKHYVQSGKATYTTRCQNCQTNNEQGQVECYKCGSSLMRQRKIEVPSVQGGGGSSLGGAWAILGGLFVVGILLFRTEPNTISGLCMGLLGLGLLAGCVAWAIRLVIWSLTGRR